MNYLICAVAMLLMAGGAFAQGTPPTQETPAPTAAPPAMEKPPAKGARGLGGGKRALMKAGYAQTGVQREEAFRDGRYHDIWCGEVLRDDWEKAQAKR